MAKLPKIVVALDTDKMDVPTLISAAKGVKTTGDPAVTDPPVTDAVMTTQAGDLSLTNSKRYTDKSKSLTLLEQDQRDILEFSYHQVGHYVQDTANKVARTTGSVEQGEAVVVRCGFKLKKKAELHPRGFEVVETGRGLIYLRVKSVGARAGYVWRYGITTEEGMPPTQFLPLLFTLSCEIIITNLTKGAMYGYQVASILPATHTGKTDASLTVNTKKSTVLSATKAKKSAFTAGVDPLNWSDFIYEGTR